MESLAREWNIQAEEFRETEFSLLTFGRRDDQQVVLKISKGSGDEWQAGKVLQAFQDGVVKVLEQVGGAVLLERIVPGNSLTDLVLAGDDDKATDVLAEVIHRLSTSSPLDGCARVEEWAKGFDRYLQSDDKQIPRDLVLQAQETYLKLCRTQCNPRLLHGDLHHANVLWDDRRGWLAIDPKGVIGEAEYEIGAALRNPIEHPELFAVREIVERRIGRLVAALDLNAQRVWAWTFAQAVLSAIWSWEDNSPGFGLKRAFQVAKICRQA